MLWLNWKDKMSLSCPTAGQFANLHPEEQHIASAAVIPPLDSSSLWHQHDWISDHSICKYRKLFLEWITLYKRKRTLNPNHFYKCLKFWMRCQKLVMFYSSVKMTTDIFTHWLSVVMVVLFLLPPSHPFTTGHLLSTACVTIRHQGRALHLAFIFNSFCTCEVNVC